MSRAIGEDAAQIRFLQRFKPHSFKRDFFPLALSGLRLYIGQRDKTLIMRHREDDPPSASIVAWVRREIHHQ
jgi:hypothetical protein